MNRSYSGSLGALQSREVARRPSELRLSHPQSAKEAPRYLDFGEISIFSSRGAPAGARGRAAGSAGLLAVLLGTGVVVQRYLSLLLGQNMKTEFLRLERV